MSENWYNRFVIRRFNRELFESKKSPESAFYAFKTNFDFNDQCIIVDNSLTKHYEKYVYGNPFPKSPKELGTGQYIVESPLIEDEINWFFLSLRKYHEEISLFVKLKLEFENFFLLGKYEEAGKSLDEIEAKISYSTWGFECRLLLKEITGGIDENKIYLSKLNKELGSNFVIALVDFFSKKAEKDTPSNRYDIDVRNTLSKIQGLYRKENIEYYHFKVNYFNHSNYSTLCSINSVEQQNSLIDRFLVFVRILQEFTINNAKESDFKILNSRIRYFQRKISFRQLDRLSTLIDDEFDFSLDSASLQALDIFDFYTKGNYEKAYKLTFNFLIQEPGCFELYIIYCKCLINLNRDFEIIKVEKDCYLNQILQQVYNLLLKNTNPIEHLTILRKNAYQLSSFSIANQIVDFSQGEVRNDQKYAELAQLSNQIVNPGFADIFEDREKASLFLRKLDHGLDDESETIQFIFHKINKTLEDGLDHLDIAQDRKEIYLALFYQQEDKVEEAVRIWSDLMTITYDKPHLYESVISNLYNCHIKLNDVDSALKLFISIYFDNNFFTLKLNPQPVLEKIRKQRFRGISVSVDLPIFFYISEVEETRVSAACEKYFAKYSVRKPSEYVDKLRAKEILEDENKIRFFLTNVCTIDLFKHIVYIKGTKAKLEERLSVINYLVETDQKEKEKYEEEKSDIERQIFIQQGIQKYDESKIFINENRMRETQFRDLEIEFQRYKKISRLIGKHSLNLILFEENSIAVQSMTVKGKGKNDDEPIFSSNPTFDLVKNMFFEVRDVFLHSQYGLTEYLSARIRHGVFKSEIRPKFEALHLITEKDTSTGKYKLNDFWGIRFNMLGPKAVEKVQGSLSRFSHNIDYLIEEEALKKYLQIKVEDKNKEGWFDYTFDNVQLAIFEVILREKETFEEFVDAVFKLLWERTDKNLEGIRNAIRGSLKDQFEKIILDLENELEIYLDKSFGSDLYENIATSKVNIQNDLERISRWFSRSVAQAQPFTIDRIVEISLEHTNKGYAEKSINLDSKISCTSRFNGEYFSDFIDLFRVFFENTLRHCGIESGIIESNLTIEHNNDELVILVSNPIYEEAIEEAKKEVEIFSGEMAESATEGKSGFKKTMRILRINLANFENIMKPEVIDDNTFVVRCTINTKKLKYEDSNN